LAAYQAVLPSKRHRPVGKQTGETAHIERFNNTLRQRCANLVRKTLSSARISSFTSFVFGCLSIITTVVLSALAFCHQLNLDHYRC